MTATVARPAGQTNDRVELGRYTTSAGKRVVYGHRVLGVVAFLVARRVVVVARRRRSEDGRCRRRGPPNWRADRLAPLRRAGASSAPAWTTASRLVRSCEFARRRHPEHGRSRRVGSELCAPSSSRSGACSRSDAGAPGSRRSARRDPQLLGSAERDVGVEAEILVGHERQIGVASGELLEREARLELAERRPEAEMDAFAER